ncbi:MAG: phosphotransferase [Parachlamydiales bacterium]|nr:phosphotransferase [Parachlamydiales bacterium]
MKKIVCLFIAVIRVLFSGETHMENFCKKYTPEIRQKYSVDPFFRFSFETFRESVEDLDSFFNEYTYLIIKPDGLVGGCFASTIKTLNEYGFEISGWDVFEFTSNGVKQFWYNESKFFPLDRFRLFEKILSDKPSVVFLLRDKRRDRENPCERLSKLKGSAESQKREAWHIRTKIGVRCPLLGFIHTPDSPLSMIRELGIILGEKKCKRFLIEGIGNSQEDKQQELNQFKQELYSKIVMHDLDELKSKDRLLIYGETLESTLGKQFKQFINDQRTGSDDFFRFVEKHNLNVPEWDLLTFCSYQKSAVVNMEESIVIDLAKRCSFFSKETFDELIVKRLGGWSNTSFKFDFLHEQYAVRLNRPNSILAIDRKAEQMNSLIADELGVGSKIEFTDGNIQVAKFIEHEGVVKAEDLAENESLSQVVLSLKKLHKSGLKFQNELRPYERLLRVYEEIGQKEGNFMDKELFFTICSLKDVFTNKLVLEAPKVPCHNDTTPYNMLRTKRGIQFVDWEHSANNDPAWDLAYLSAEANLTQDDDLRMIDLYDPEDKLEFMTRFSVYKPLTHLWIYVWIYTQIYSKNEVVSEVEFRKLASERLAKAFNLMSQTPFKNAVKFLQNQKLLEPSQYKERLAKVIS